MSAWTGPDLVRVGRDVARLHDLGPRPLLEFLAELASDQATRADIELNLRRYARLVPGLVAVLGGRDLRPPVFVVDDDDAVPTQAMRGAA